MISEERFWLDMLVLIGIGIAIYYLKMQAGDTVSPADGIMSLVELMK